MRPSADNTSKPSLTFSVPRNAVLSEGDEIRVTHSYAPPEKGRKALVAIAFIRDGDNAAIAGPSFGASTALRTTGTFVLTSQRYLWARGHVLNGAILEAYFDTTEELFDAMNNGYFGDRLRDTEPVHLERANRCTAIELNWRVQ